MYTMDGTVDWRGHPSSRQDTGKWFAGVIILGKFDFNHIYINLLYVFNYFLIYICDNLNTKI